VVRLEMQPVAACLAQDGDGRPADFRSDAVAVDGDDVVGLHVVACSIPRPQAAGGLLMTGPGAYHEAWARHLHCRATVLRDGAGWLSVEGMALARHGGRPVTRRESHSLP